MSRGPRAAPRPTCRHSRTATTGRRRRIPANQPVPDLLSQLDSDHEAHAVIVARSAPAKLRRDVAQDRIEDVGAVVHTELIGDSQQQCVGGGDRLVLGQLLYEFSGSPA